MADKVLNIMVGNPHKLCGRMTGKEHADCHHSYNLPLYSILKNCYKFLEKKHKILIFGKHEKK